MRRRSGAGDVRLQKGGGSLEVIPYAHGRVKEEKRSIEGGQHFFGAPSEDLAPRS